MNSKTRSFFLSISEAVGAKVEVEEEALMVEVLV